MDPVVHFEMPAKDKKRVKNFYESAFGWQMQQLGAEMANYILATSSPVDKKGMHKKKGAINGGFFDYDPQKPGFQQPSVVIAVDNLDQSIEKVKQAGGKILDKPMDIPGIGMFVSFHDSENNRVGMLQSTM